MECEAFVCAWWGFPSFFHPSHSLELNTVKISRSQSVTSGLESSSTSPRATYLISRDLKSGMCYSGSMGVITILVHHYNEGGMDILHKITQALPCLLEQHVSFSAAFTLPKIPSMPLSFLRLPAREKPGLLNKLTLDVTTHTSPVRCKCCI